MEETIDLREYFAIIKKRMTLIIGTTLSCAVISGIVSFFVLSPVYEAKTTLIVNSDSQMQENAILTGDQFNVTQRLAVTYGEIIKSRTVLEPVIEKLNLDITYEDFTKKVRVSPVSDTQIINISVEDINPLKARDIANSIPVVFSDEVKRITKANGVEVIDLAVEPVDPIKPNKVMNVLIAMVLGFMISIFVTFLIEFMDKKVKTPMDIEKHLDLPILGVIPFEE
ncbi:MAG: Wzz/FepE/Etk N-terminal domain-containing protein [Peptostreptococcaceae bacterium]